jgi:(+)-beta-caryophyllene/(+)-caryolan-1-ol synthase
MPFPYREPNSGLRAAEAGMWDWIDRFGLFTSAESQERLRQLRLPLNSARYHALADPLSLPLLNLPMIWGWVVDEQFDDGAVGRDVPRCCAALSGLTDVVRHGTVRPGANPIEAAGADLCQRLFEHRSPRWVQDFKHTVIDWLWAYYVEAVDRATGRYPTLDSYRPHRVSTSDERMFMLLSEYGGHIDLPAAVTRLPAYRQLMDAAAEHMGLFNDVISLPKESPIGYHHNAVTLVAHYENVDTHEAAERVNTMLTDCIQRMLDAEQELPPQLAATHVSDQVYADALRMVQAIKAHTRGNFDWHFEVTRYDAPGPLTDEGKPAYVPDLLP